jgi:hypothetical protein
VTFRLGAGGSRGRWAHHLGLGATGRALQGRCHTHPAWRARAFGARDPQGPQEGPRRLHPHPARPAAGHRGEPVIAPGCLQRHIVPARQPEHHLRGGSGLPGAKSAPGCTKRSGSPDAPRSWCGREARGVTRDAAAPHTRPRACRPRKRGPRKLCHYPVLPSAEDSDDDRVTAPACPCSSQSSQDIPGVTADGEALRLSWWIQAPRLIEGAGRQARINHANVTQAADVRAAAPSPRLMAHRPQERVVPTLPAA